MTAWRPPRYSLTCVLSPAAEMAQREDVWTSLSHTWREKAQRTGYRKCPGHRKNNLKKNPCPEKELTDRHCYFIYLFLFKMAVSGQSGKTATNHKSRGGAVSGEGGTAVCWVRNRGAGTRHAPIQAGRGRKGRSVFVTHAGGAWLDS